MSEDTYRLAGWFTLDLRLLATLLLFAAALAVLILALRLKDRRWEEYVVSFLAIFSLGFLAALALTQWVGSHPALGIETIFPIP